MDKVREKIEKEIKKTEQKQKKNEKVSEKKETDADIIDRTNENEEVLVLKNTIENLEERIKQTQADLINYRKRKDEEVSNKLKFASQDLIFEILPVLDNFERALKMGNSEDEKLNNFLKGFQLSYDALLNTLKSHGVEEIDTNCEFDPTIHTAMMVDKDETKANNAILEVLIKGYKLNGRVIRPASVKVNKLD